ncbi:MAG TPA: 2-dehydro-3-deoxygalactonokinase [Rhizobiaceae bacterium]|nr:2-dehydro-3-deoxygalactonokinase [Rhizobiaceae bacterium]
MAEAVFAAADWGTTRLRVWLLDAQGNLLAERRADDGLLSVEKGGFEAMLEKHLDALEAPKDVPAILCGMVGSRQGWIEAPYVAVPASLDDVMAGAVRVSGARRDVRIVPGAALKRGDRPDVMRGEETQLAGIALLGTKTATVCMPGTHSKWVALKDSGIADFSTWMTGELFSTLSAHTILKHSTGAEAHTIDAASDSFRTWLMMGLDNPQDLTTRLFKIRATGLVSSMNQPDAAAALSGLLIGTEIGSARKLFGGDVITLVGGGTLGKLYEAALGLAGLKVSVVDADNVVLAGLVAAARRNFTKAAL